MGDNVTATELAGITSWGVPLLSAFGGAVVGFILKLLWDKRQEKKKERKEKLKVHFDTINEEVLGRIYHMSSSLIIEHNELIFGSSEEEIIPQNLSGEEIHISKKPILEHYEFEKDDNYFSFEIHFSKIAQEWGKLKNEAVILKSYFNIVITGPSINNKDKYEYARKKINDGFFPLQKKFRDFAQKLNSDVETIRKYQIGTVFKYNKKCPICKKF